MKHTLNGNRDLVVLLTGTAVSFVVAALLVGLVFREQNRQSREGVIAKTALCAFKADLQERIDGSLSFLARHPHGFAGVDVAAVRVSIANQQATLRSLSVLKCSN